MNPLFIKASSRAALILLCFSVVGTALLSLTFDQTKPIIAKSEEQEKLALIGQTLPNTLYDNDIIADTITLPAGGKLNNPTEALAYRARAGGTPVALVLEATAPDGYSGRIRLLIAIRVNGELAGVRVIAHNETPGLGDYIDIAKNKWIRIFEGKSLSHPGTPGWKVKKDGGQFDYMAGATITPRAIVKAVKSALEFFGEQRESLFRHASTNDEALK